MSVDLDVAETHHHSPDLGTVVTLREVRETAFRALVAVGASAGEAALAAEQVLVAEIHHGCGLQLLGEDLDRGQWPRDGLSVVSTRADGRVVHRIAGVGRSGPLRCAGLAADFATAEPEGHVVIVAGLGLAGPGIDHALLAAAAANRCTLTAAGSHSGAGWQLRSATSDGDLVLGNLDMLETWTVPHLAAGEVALMRTAAPPSERGQWSTREQRVQARRRAARAGLEVDAGLWKRVYQASRAYLVPES